MNLLKLAASASRDRYRIPNGACRRGLVCALGMVNLVVIESFSRWWLFSTSSRLKKQDKETGNPKSRLIKSGQDIAIRFVLINSERNNLNMADNKKMVKRQWKKILQMVHRCCQKAELATIRAFGAVWLCARTEPRGRIKKRPRLASKRWAYHAAHVHTESLLERKDHVGFAPGWHGWRREKLPDVCVRPTSETLFCDHYRDIIHSYRDLPKLYNQWCSVVRWEKTTRPFLRTTEFFWQEGHTMHETAGEAMEETRRMLDVYADFCEQSLAIPVLKGRKTDKEKFAGAEATYTIEAMMHDGKALQSGTSHYFGDGFARAFEIQFTGRDNTLQYPFQTSWGMSTRIIGAIIMTHGDDNGLVLPPAVAPNQLVIIPIAPHKPGVLDAAAALCERLKPVVRVKMDDSDNSAGWKFAEHEMIPLRLELGPDIENNQCVMCAVTTVKRRWFHSTSRQRLPKREGVHGLYRKALEQRESADLFGKHGRDEAACG